MAQLHLQSEGLDRNSGMNDTDDSDSSFLQNIELQKSTAQSPNPLPAPPLKHNPLDAASMHHHSYIHASSQSQNIIHEIANCKHMEHSKSRNDKWIRISLVICISYSFIGVTFLLYAHFANMSNNNNCECVYPDSQQIASSQSNATLLPSQSPTTLEPTASAPTPLVFVYNLSSGLYAIGANYLQPQHAAHQWSIGISQHHSLSITNHDPVITTNHSGAFHWRL